MKKLSKTEKSNNYRIRFNFPFLGGGGVQLWKSKSDFFSMSGMVTLLSKYGNAEYTHFSVYVYSKGNLALYYNTVQAASY